MVLSLFLEQKIYILKIKQQRHLLPAIRLVILIFKFLLLEFEKKPFSQKCVIFQSLNCSSVEILPPRPVHSSLNWTAQPKSLKAALKSYSCWFLYLIWQFLNNRSAPSSKNRALSSLLFDAMFLIAQLQFRFEKKILLLV